MRTIGSLFSGYSGLDMAVEAVTGGHTIWRSDIDPGACKIIAHHWPGVPNLGDISTVDWSQVGPVDVITGGFPCQDVSTAGRRAGLSEGTRSGLWAMMATAISHLRPSLVVIENVRGLLSAAADSDVEPCPWCVGDPSDEPPLRALGAVLGDLADIGYDAAWHGLTAASVGAPHGRFRVFIVAWPQSGDANGIHRQGGSTAGLTREAGSQAGSAADADGLGYERAGEAWRWRCGSADSGELPANPDITGSQRPQPASGRDLSDGRATADPEGNGQDEGWAEPAGLVRGSDAAQRGDAAADARCNEPGRRRGLRDMGGASSADEGEARQRQRVRHATGDSGSIDWGQFEPAVRRWERLTRPAPAPTETSARGGQRLSPKFVEWMMGLPEGHVTEVPGLTRNEQLKALGNGVVPAQAEAALRVLLSALAVAA